MDKEIQDLAWSALPKEFKEYIIKVYKAALECSISDAHFLENIFGKHNLISDSEGEEMICVSRKRVQELYAEARKAVPTCEHDKGFRNAELTILRNLFGSKCLPDKVDSLEPEASRAEISDKEFDEVIKLAIKTYGKEAQTQMLFEEMAELQNAICKLNRGRGTAGDVCEEIADVMIMCLQMAQIYGPKLVEGWAEYKIARLKARLINTPPGMSGPKIHPLFTSEYNVGVAEALSSQWKDPKTEIPEDEQQVLVETDCEDKGLRYAIAYYLAGAWHFPDDWYYDCRVLRWQYIPCVKGGQDGNQ